MATCREHVWHRAKREGHVCGVGDMGMGQEDGGVGTGSTPALQGPKGGASTGLSCKWPLQVTSNGAQVMVPNE